MNKCIEAVNQFAAVWDSTSKANRRKMVSALFQSIFYDLNQQKIVDFKNSTLDGTLFHLASANGKQKR